MTLRARALVALLCCAPALAADPPAPRLLWTAEADRALNAAAVRAHLAPTDLAPPAATTPLDLQLPGAAAWQRGPIDALEQAAPLATLAAGAASLENEGALGFLAASAAHGLLGIPASERYDLGDPQGAADQLTELGKAMLVVQVAQPDLDEPARAALAQFVVDAGRARRLAAEALAPLTREDREQLAAALRETAYPQGGAPEGFPGAAIALPTALHRGAALARGDKLDRRVLARAGGTLLLACDTFLSLFPHDAAGWAFRRDVPGVAGDALGPIDTPAGPLYVGGPGPNVWRVPGALVIDLGGDDRYELPPPTVPLEGGASLAVVIDYSGDDSYVIPGPGGPGGALFGLSVLRDMAGRDVYDGGPLTEGAAWCGEGFLLDGGGDDVYRAPRFAQGAAGFGVGLLADFAGNDAYRVEALGQGFGAPLGVGALADRAGDDVYAAADGPAQGGAAGAREERIAGGVGLFWDAAGSDVVRGAGCAQGCGRTGGFGLFVDGAGDDVLAVERGGQALGLDGGSGVLVDLAGNDRRIAAGGPAQAAAAGRGVAALLDVAGDDLSLCGASGQGYVDGAGAAIYADYAGSDLATLGPGASGQGREARRGAAAFFLALGAPPAKARP